VDATGDKWTGLDDDGHRQDLGGLLDDGGVPHEDARMAFASQEAHHCETAVADDNIGVARAA